MLPCCIGETLMEQHEARQSHGAGSGSPAKPDLAPHAASQQFPAAAGQCDGLRAGTLLPPKAEQVGDQQQRATRPPGYL